MQFRWHMTGNQPDQQICEIFFLCLDLIKKDLSCVASLQSSGRKCFRKLWKVSAKCTWTFLQTDQKAGAQHGIAVFPAQHTMALPLPTKRKIPAHSSLPSAPQPIFSPGTEVKKHMGTYPELLQLFLKWSPSQNAVCFAPYCAFQSSLVWYKSPECVCCWFCE